MPLPEGVVPPSEDNDDLQEEMEALMKDSKKWQDLGVSQLQ